MHVEYAVEVECIMTPDEQRAHRLSEHKVENLSNFGVSQSRDHCSALILDVYSS